jgi:hypothetical protein
VCVCVCLLTVRKEQNIYLKIKRCIRIAARVNTAETDKREMNTRSRGGGGVRVEKARSGYSLFSALCFSDDEPPGSKLHTIR